MAAAHEIGDGRRHDRHGLRLFGFSLTGAALTPARWLGPTLLEAISTTHLTRNPWADTLVYLAGPILGWFLAGLSLQAVEPEIDKRNRPSGKLTNRSSNLGPTNPENSIGNCQLINYQLSIRDQDQGWSMLPLTVDDLLPLEEYAGRRKEFFDAQ